MTPSHSRGARDRPVLIHSSDELYGSDRMVLQIIDSMPAVMRARLEVILPLQPTGPAGLTLALRDRGVTVEHQRLPILRRRDLTNPLALVMLAWRTLALAWILRRRGVGLVYCATSATAPVLVSARLAGADESVIHVQEVWGRQEAILIGGLARLAGVVVTISQAVYDALPSGVRRRAVVVENGIATEDRANVSPPSSGPLRFLVASRWNSWKGHRTLLAAWDLGDPPGILTVAGSAPEMGDGVDVEKLVSALKEPASIEIVGQVGSIFDLLDDVDVLIVPSDSPEPFGLVAIEAFSRGRPVIGSDGGGLADIIEQEINGLKYPVGDVASLSCLLRTVDRPKLRRLGEAAARTYADKYAADAFSSRMSKIWENTGMGEN